MNLGLSLFGNLTVNEMSEIAVEAERSGFDSVWVAEGPGTDAFVACAEIAKNTSKIEIGTDIVSIYTRHPCVLASASASIDLISKGRFRLGLGASHRSIVENQLGLNFSKPVKRMEEAIQIVKTIIKSGTRPVNFNGEVFAISEYSLWFDPFRDIIEIYLAAGGPQMTDLLAREADGSLFFLKSEEALKNAIQRISEISKRSSKHVPEIGVVMSCAFHEDGNLASRAARQTIAMYLVQYEAFRKSLGDQGFGDEVKKIMAAGNSIEAASKFVTSKMIEEFSLCGGKTEIKNKIGKCRSAGIDLLILEPCFFPGEKLAETLRRTIELAQ